MAFLKKPVPDPEPGIGGYDYPRGPTGETGYTGSTYATRIEPPEAEDRLHDNYNGHKPRRRWQTFASQQARYDQSNWNEPVNPNRVRDTEQRAHFAVSQNTPGNNNQRNTIYNGGMKAQPGRTHSYHAAPNPSDGHQRGFGATPTVSQTSRYVYGGINGGTDLYQDTLTARRMPYTGQGGFRGNLGHARGGVRGAVNDGSRYYQLPDIGTGIQGGAYGQNTRGKQRHRPTIFREPAPWTSRFYDTTAETGTPDHRGAHTQVADKVHVSPHIAPRRNRGF